MNRSNTNQASAIIAIILRHWEEISAIEERYNIRVGKGDMRVRIEFFHDAIRAHAAATKTKDMESRLSIERLSYDVQCLRYIASMPLASLTHDTHHLSPQQSLLVAGPGLISSEEKINRQTKDQLKELYTQYGVLFASLLRTAADQDYYNRTDEMNEAVTTVNQIVNALESGGTNLNAMIEHLENEELKSALTALLPKIRGKQAAAIHNAIAKLRNHIKGHDKTIKTIDTAHHHYATTQLALYEAAKPMLKALAGQGMNLVGQFVESTLRAGQQGRSR